MKVIINRKSFLEAFDAVTPAVPARSPKAILQNVMFVASEDGCEVMATDLEVGIVRRVLDVRVETPGSAVLPTHRLGLALKACPDAELTLETDDNKLHVWGVKSRWSFAAEDPQLYPEVPRSLDAGSEWTVASADLKRTIRRCLVAVDQESRHYALGGVYFASVGGDEMECVATDSRRLAVQRMIANLEGGEGSSPQLASPVVPAKALKLIERSLPDDDSQIGMTLDSRAVLFRCDRTTLYTRTVEGRFPRYQDVFPTGRPHKVPLEVAAFKGAVEQASIATSDESRAVDFDFEGAAVVLSGQASDVGESRIELALAEPLPARIEIAFDPRYMLDGLRHLDADASIVAELIDGKMPAVFRTGDGFTYVMMPMTREPKAKAA